MKRVYLDHAATTPVDPEVVETMLPYLRESFGNPSAIYSLGQEAAEAVDDAREKVAALIGAKNEEVVFTSGGTEADNFAIEGAAYAKEAKGNHIITSQIEHHAVLETCHFIEKRGFEITRVPVDEYGIVDPQIIADAITEKTVLISVMYASNEVGSIQPIAEIGRIARERGVLFHTDAVQAAGHIPLNVTDLNVDLLSMSAHKLYGPKGVGALYIRKGTRIAPFMHGGGQERGRRSSTENVPGIVGFGKAAAIALSRLDSESQQLIGLRDRLIEGIKGRINRVKLNGHPTQRLPNNVNFTIQFIEGEAMLLNLDLQGIAASTGSACSSGDLHPSHVLLALGLPHEDAHSSLRFTLGRSTTEDDINRVLEVLPPIVDNLRAMSPLAKSVS